MPTQWEIEAETMKTWREQKFCGRRGNGKRIWTWWYLMIPFESGLEMKWT
jgi:hypothetical protein